MKVIFMLIYVTAAVVALTTPRYDIYQIEDQPVQVTFKNVFSKKYLTIKPCLGECSEHIIAKPASFDPKVALSLVIFLRVEGVIWPPLPHGEYLDDLETVDFFNATPRGGFGACNQLENLYIDSSDLSMTSPDWLTKCKFLTKIYIRRLDVSQIRSAVRSALHVESLFMVDLQKIEEWANVDQNPIFSNRLIITKVDMASTDNLEHNKTSWALVSAGILQQLSLLPRLRKLFIDLHGFDICAGEFASVTLGSLRTLDLYNDNTTRFCFRDYRVLPKLQTLTVGCRSYNAACQHNDIKLNVVEIFSSPGQQVDVVAVNTALKFVYQLSRKDYLMLSGEPEKKMVYFEMRLYGEVSVDCDCLDMFWLARAIKMGFITASALICRNGMPFSEFSCDRLECESVPCNSECLCCRIGPHEEFIADCRGLKLTQLPHDLLGLPNITEVYAPNNNITSLPETLPENLTLVDVSGNQIRNIHGALFANKLRRWRLAGNPLTCECDNVQLLDTLQHQKQQIEDLENATCVIETLETSLITLPGVCKSLELNTTLAKEKEIKNLEAQLAKDREETLVISVAVVTVVAIIASILGLAFYYRRPIQILLFARGWCLCWLKEEDSDEDRRYDVFLSFCHEDAELVLGQLLPTLDQEYSVCVHLRDWMPGEIIPMQIRTSVENSRRTLIFLTKNFAESLWGLLEFQTAYARGLEERRIRVVMVVVDDVLESPDLNKDLREYVQFNTYVRWGDPWFWSKLRYALPHRVTSFQTPHAETEQYIVPAVADAPPRDLSMEIACENLPSPDINYESDNYLPQEIPEAPPSHFLENGTPSELTLS